jgi:TP901 family phage tail tape measure protein
MSDYTTKATAVLAVNGDQAKSEIPKLKKLIVDLQVAVNNAAKDGNKPLLKNLKKELKDARKQLKDFESAAHAADYVMRNLDKATPKQLSAALRQLKKELNDIDRGSKAWDEHIRKIKRVQTELDRVNSEMKGHQTLWTRFSKTMFQWGNALMVAAGALSGLVISGRRAVSAFAEMDQEMANVRKYTGMAAEQVEALNEEFKKMDTRSSRQQLNKLAQEAGRLGMQSEEDVMGFVRAADKINVALDELGEGATLTLSKLTNIFGDRERLGVEKSLLAVGSVINELSQNSTASASYLAEFTSRLGGVGAQAHMTTQQIMGYGAVLDSYNQKVESSSTALSQVIVRLYREPAKYAKVAGLDVKAFTDLLKQDANAALIMFLETLNKAGDMDVLSPMFADMGENGARAIQALSTLAKHIDEVKAQQQAANVAFDEAVSIDKEFNVQNNTVQAQLDKAKKGFNELAVSLGEKLMPVMRYAITGSSAMIRALSITIDFFIKYKGAIFTVTAAIVAYKVAVNAANIIDNVHYVLLLAKDAIMKTHKVTVLMCSVAYNKLTGNIVRANAAQKLLNTTMKLNPWGLVAAAIAAAVVALVAFAKRTKEVSAAQKEFNKLSNEMAEERKRRMEQLDRETSKIRFLAECARDETQSLETRKSAIAKLNSIIPNYCARLDEETGKYYENKQALDSYLQSLEKKIRLEANRAEYERLIQEDERLRREIAYGEDAGRDLVNRSMSGATSRQQREAIAHAYGASIDANGNIHNAPVSGQTRTLIEQRNLVQQRIKKLLDYTKDIDLLEEEAAGDGGGGGYTPSGGSGSGSHGGSAAKPDKFAAEKSWRERELALNKIAWLRGERDFEAYTEIMLEIETQYHEKRLAHTDLVGNERVTIEAEYLEAMKKQQQQYDQWTIEEENQAYEDLKREIQDDYLQKRITTETYNMELENIEMAHMRALTYITREGTDERKKAEDEYRARLVSDQQKRQKEYEAAVKKHQEELTKIYDTYYLSDKEQKDRRYAEAKALIEEVYKQELAKAGENEEKKADIQKRHAEALKKLYEEIYGENEKQAQSLEEWIGRFMDKLFGEGTWEKYGEMLKSMYSSIASMFDGLSKMAEADSELRLARLEKYYEREISMAEGNAYKVKQIERKKQKEEAKLKAEASKKQFAQQVISAVAETALAAINAYASASKVSWILGPIAAAMAVAAGGIQIAAIKKQQAASLAQGYSSGGFTPDGRPDQPVGIVHAGEWVASQKLLKNPNTRAAIDALDYAQRNNMMGRISAADVSRSVTAPSVIAGAAGDGSMQRTMEAMVAVMARYGDTMSRLGDRLEEPFVTVNTVEGDMGIKRAQDDYQKMMNNTLPKNKRK